MEWYSCWEARVSLQEDCTITPCTSVLARPFPHVRYPAISNTRDHFVLIFANLIGEKQYSIVAWVCISWVSGEAKYLFLRLWAIWISLADMCHCPVLGEALVGVSSLSPSPPRATGSVAPLKCDFVSSKALLATGLASQGSWVLILRSPSQPELGLVGSSSLTSRCPLTKSPLFALFTSLCQGDFRNQICLKKKSFLKFQTHPANTFQGWLLAWLEEPFQNIPLESSAPGRFKIRLHICQDLSPLKIPQPLT